MNSMLWDSATPDAEKGSKKFPEEGGGEKHPEETPTGKLVMPFLQFLFGSHFVGFCNPSFFSRFPISREYSGENS